jgi:hypothetical protein
MLKEPNSAKVLICTMDCIEPPPPDEGAQGDAAMEGFRLRQRASRPAVSVIQSRLVPCIRGGDIFFAGDVLEGGTARLQQSSADFVGSNQQPNQARVDRGGIRRPIDDELHLFSRAFQPRRNAPARRQDCC